VVIRVCDNGMGITPELLPRIFDLFTQGDRTIERSQGGLGIGLSLVHLLVELHGGRVEARSEGAGKGSEFVVHLPALETTSAQPAADLQPPTIAPRRVLVVEDNVGAAVILAKMLAKLWQHDVRVAHDGPRALEVISEWQPEVVVLDIGLPGMNGFEVARQIRSDPRGQSMLLASLSGYGTEEDRHKSLDAGIDVHLVKPASSRALQDLFLHPRLTR